MEATATINTDGYTDIPPAHVAAIVTYLEMCARPAPPAEPPGVDLELRQEAMDVARYRGLYRRIGTDWLWNARLRMADAALDAILADPATEVHVPCKDGSMIGLLELDFRVSGEAEIAYLGLLAEHVGQGYGRWLMNRALERAWRDGVARVTVHTCTLDHPSALAFYRRSGFRAYARKLEVFPDPRLNGVPPRDAAPRVPLIEA